MTPNQHRLSTSPTPSPPRRVLPSPPRRRPSGARSQNIVAGGSESSQIINNRLEITANDEQDDDSSELSEMDDDALAELMMMITPVSKSPTINQATGSRAPRRPHGFVPVGTVDRGRAIYNQPDNSRLTVQFTIKGLNDEERVIKYEYNKVVVWNSRDSVKKANNWRDQIIRRNFDRIRKDRPIWIEKEMSIIADLIKSQLKTRSQVAWNRLVNKYNTENKNVKHSIGEKHLHSQHNSNSGHHLKVERDAPWRLAAAVKRQVEKCPDVNQLIRDAKATVDQDTFPDSSDEEELDDPNPGPPVGKQSGPRIRKGGRKRARKNAAEEARAAEANGDETTPQPKKIKIILRTSKMNQPRDGDVHGELQGQNSGVDGSEDVEEVKQKLGSEMVEN